MQIWKDGLFEQIIVVEWLKVKKNLREVVEKKLHECIALNEYYIWVKTICEGKNKDMKS